MATKDIFAPPSADEAKLFAPPSPEEFAGAQGIPQVSQLESALRGGAQGLSLGYADELAGAAGAAGDVLSGQSDISKLADVYRQHRDESRALYKAAKEANPKTYLASEIGGGVAGAFIPGLNAAKGIKGAALLGGAMGLGNSEADLTQGEVQPAFNDAVKGAALGGVVGAAGEGLAKVLSKAPQAAEKLANEAQYGAIGAGAKDIGRDLGLGRTVFPGKAVKAGEESLERGMPETLRENNIVGFTGGSKAAMDKLDVALDANKAKYGEFFNNIKDAVAEKASQNPDLSVPAVPGTQVSDITGKSILDSFNALKQGFIGGLKKQFGTSGAADKFSKDAEDYSKLLKEADFDLPKLNELKQMIGKQLSDTNWYTAGPELAPQKEFLKQTYGLIKGRMEDLADQVSPGAGDTMRTLNQEYGNLATARGIAFKEYTKQLNGPMFGPLDVAGAVAAVGTHSPGVLATLAAKKGLELGTGNSIDRLSKIATAKALDSIAKSLNAASEPEAQGIAAQLMNLSQNPSLVARVSGLSALMSNPTTRQIIEPHIAEAPKDVQPQTSPLVTGGQKPQNVGYDRQYDAVSLDAMVNKITPDMGTTGGQLKNILNNMKDKDARSRNAMMFSLQQNPAYRPLLKKLEGKEDETP